MLKQFVLGRHLIVSNSPTTKDTAIIIVNLPIFQWYIIIDDVALVLKYGEKTSYQQSIRTSAQTMISNRTILM